MSRSSSEIVPPRDGENQTVPAVIVLQNPKQARMTGFSEQSSTRVIDPPLVLEVFPKVLFGLSLETTTSSSTSTEEPISNKRAQNEIKNLICVAKLYPEDENEVCSFVRLVSKNNTTDDGKVYHVLLGQTIKHCIHIASQEAGGEKRYLFVFNDLGVRIHGKYRLGCTITHPRYILACLPDLTSF